MNKSAPRLLPDQRRLFDIPDDVAYLNCAYMSPLMHLVAKAGRQAVSVKQRPWNITPPDFFDLPNRGRELFAETAAGNTAGNQHHADRHGEFGRSEREPLPDPEQHRIRHQHGDEQQPDHADGDQMARLDRLELDDVIVHVSEPGDEHSADKPDDQCSERHIRPPP